MEISELPTLSSVVQILSARDKSGLCFHRSAALCHDLPHSMVVVGTLDGEPQTPANAPLCIAREQFLHCWVEYQGQVIAPTLIELHGGLNALDRYEYYSTNGVRDVRRIARGRLMSMFKRNPDFIQHLRGLVSVTNRSFAKTLLNLAKVPYRVENGGVYPAKSVQT